MGHDEGSDPDHMKQFERLAVTCSVCGKTNRIAVWKRIASESHAPFSITRIAKETRYTCPHCYRAGLASV